MFRASRVNHPRRWIENGFCEIQEPSKRYAIIDLGALSELCGFEDVEGFHKAHRQWIEEALTSELSLRDGRWSEAIAVGSLVFVEKIKGELGIKALHRELEPMGAAYTLREPSESYTSKCAGENDALTPENTDLWQENGETAGT